MKNELIVIIPARRNSKGFPFKNRRLIEFSASAARGVVDEGKIYITTDDEEIMKRYENESSRINVINRPQELGEDNTSMKDVLLHAIAQIKPSDDTLIVVLYPTYPERESVDIQLAISFFKKNKAKSLLCRKQHVGIHPFLLMFPTDNYGGKQIVNHNLYRRQDYPPVFEISHFMIIMRVSELEHLNLNLYNQDTVFYAIDNVVDVDAESDYDSLINNMFS